MRNHSPRRHQMRKLERKQGNRPLYPRLLIVCEGEKTEPNYFGEIRQKWRIPSLNWKILPSGFGTGPEKVVEFAEFKAKIEGRWEEVYCVFDRDKHLHYDEAMTRAQNINRKLRTKEKGNAAVCFKAIPSDPCFELWFLIHFQELTREEQPDEVLRLLKSHVPEYHKSCNGMFSRTINMFQEACKRASELRQRKERTGNANPSTDVDILVTRLNEIGEMNYYKGHK